MNLHLQLLRDYESRNVTHLGEGGFWPIVWDRAKGGRTGPTRKTPSRHGRRTPTRPQGPTRQ